MVKCIVKSTQNELTQNEWSKYMDFVGRKNELSKLQELYRSDCFEGIVIYGRRQIGKSELIKKSFELADCRCVYFECTKATILMNADNIAELIAKNFDIPKPAFTNVTEAIEYVAKMSQDKPIVLVIDEYPYIRDSAGVMDSEIQKVIDAYKNKTKLKLILCGSYVDVMKGLLSESNPLYKRISTSMNITQMNYYESALFYPDYSPEQKLEIYSVFGGVPYYNQFIDTKLSVKQNIINLILDKNGRLSGGPESSIEQEISKMTNANEVFMAIARGKSKFSDILAKSNVSSSPALANILNRLQVMDVIVKNSPINDESEKKSNYRISDRFSLFFYKYIFTRKSMLASMSAEMFWNEFIENDFNSDFVPRTYEVVARQFLVRKNIEGLISPVLYKVGTYYYDDKKNRTNGEFDVVTLNRDGYDFYEVKYTEKPVNDSVVREELYQLKNVSIPFNRLGFFSKNGFEITESDKYILYNLEDVYS